MLIIWIPLGLIILSVLVLIVIAGRKVPYLRALDVLSLPEHKVKELKNSLVAKRLSRVGQKWGGTAKTVLAPFAGLTKASVGAIKTSITNLEERYQKLKKESIAPHGMDADTVKKMVAESEQMVKEGRYGEAEKKLIEVLSHDPKNLLVYEDLGDLYMSTKNFDQAEETYKFILKTHPSDASVLTSLGEIELQKGKPKEASVYFGKAVKKRPNNPKYLDFLVEASILAGDTVGARRALERLRAANPENHKLGDFEERIKEKEGEKPVKSTEQE